jgi:hypothetical protein
MLAFAFAILLIVFRSVLFRLMAVYVAYRRAVINWATRASSAEVGRGPVLVSLYAVVDRPERDGRLVRRAKLSDTRRAPRSGLKAELDKSAPATPADHRNNTSDSVPAGLELGRPAAGASARCSRADRRGPARRRVLDSAGLHHRLPTSRSDRGPEAAALSARRHRRGRGRPRGEGAELTSEKWVIAPVARQIERISGSHFDRASSVDFVKERSDSTARTSAAGSSREQKIPVTIVGSLYELLSS